MWITTLAASCTLRLEPRIMTHLSPALKAIGPSLVNGSTAMTPSGGGPMTSSNPRMEMATRNLACIRWLILYSGPTSAPLILLTSTDSGMLIRRTTSSEVASFEATLMLLSVGIGESVEEPPPRSSSCPADLFRDLLASVSKLMEGTGGAQRDDINDPSSSAGIVCG